MTDKQHERKEQSIVKAALKVQQYCEDYVGYCNCGDDGRPCVFWIKTDDGDEFCCVRGEPKHWGAEDLLKEDRK